MDEPPTATTLDLETEEKNFLAELFPPSAQIEQVGGTPGIWQDFCRISLTNLIFF